jgi:C_GCAxxG_C_C family probable redox protein
MRKKMRNTRVQVGVVRRFKEGWLCAEAVTLAVLDHYKVEADLQIVQAASAFNFGMGGTGKCYCGAFTGGILTLGVLLGRNRQAVELSLLHSEVKAFRQWFIENHGSLNCQELVDSFGDLRRSECVGLAANTADYLTSRGIDIQKTEAGKDEKRSCVMLGECPFSGGK